jgi:hypothetical protein
MPILTIKAKIHATPQTEAVLKERCCALQKFTTVFSGIFEKSMRKRVRPIFLGKT